MALNRRSVKLYLGCGNNRYSVLLGVISGTVDEWCAKNLRQIGIPPEKITGMRVGPRTVMQIYNSPNLIGRHWYIINDRYDVDDFVNLECGNCNNCGKVGSFRIWTYEHYYQINNVRYCRTDCECADNEYCLCPNGSRHISNCPDSKKRCMHISKYRQTKEKDITGADLVDLNCLNKQIEGSRRGVVRFNDVKRMSENCYECMLNYNSSNGHCTGLCKEPHEKKFEPFTSVGSVNGTNVNTNNNITDTIEGFQTITSSIDFNRPTGMFRFGHDDSYYRYYRDRLYRPIDDHHGYEKYGMSLSDMLFRGSTKRCTGLESLTDPRFKTLSKPPCYDQLENPYFHDLRNPHYHKLRALTPKKLIDPYYHTLREPCYQKLEVPPMTDLEKPFIEVEKPTMDLEQPLQTLEQPTMNLEKPTMDLEEQPMDLEEQLMDLEEQPMDLEEQPMDLEEQTMDLEQPTMDLEQPLLSLDYIPYETMTAKNLSITSSMLLLSIMTLMLLLIIVTQG